MGWSTHHSIIAGIADMYGPDFLILYGCVIAVTLLGCLWVVRSRDRTKDLPPLRTAKAPDPYEIAYLRGGENELTRLVIFGLIQRGYLEVIEEKENWWQGLKTRIGANMPKQRLAQSASHPERRYLSPVGREVFDNFSTSREASEIFGDLALPDRIKRYCHVFDERAEREQLLYPGELIQATWVVGLTGALIILGMGGYKLLAALATGHTNVAGLILMGSSGLLCLGYFLQPPRLSLRGQRYLEQLKHDFEYLLSFR